MLMRKKSRGRIEVCWKCRAGGDQESCLKDSEMARDGG